MFNISAICAYKSVWLCAINRPMCMFRYYVCYVPVSRVLTTNSLVSIVVPKYKICDFIMVQCIPISRYASDNFLAYQIFSGQNRVVAVLKCLVSNIFLMLR